MKVTFKDVNGAMLCAGSQCGIVTRGYRARNSENLAENELVPFQLTCAMCATQIMMQQVSSIHLPERRMAVR